MNGRSIQDIIPPARSKPIRPPVISQTPPPVPPTPPPHMPENYSQAPREGGRSMMPFVVIGLGAVILVAAVVGLMSTIFHTATAEVVVSEWRSDVSGSYTAGGGVVS